MLADPMVFWGFGNDGTIRWSDIDLPDPHGILGQAAEFGLKYGVAVALGPTSSRTIGGFARDDREFSDDEIAEIADDRAARARSLDPAGTADPGAAHGAAAGRARQPPRRGGGAARDLRKRR